MSAFQAFGIEIHQNVETALSCMELNVVKMFNVCNHGEHYTDHYHLQILTFAIKFKHYTDHYHLKILMFAIKFKHYTDHYHLKILTFATKFKHYTDHFMVFSYSQSCQPFVYK